MNKKKPLKVYDLKPGHDYFLVKDVDKAVKFLPNPEEDKKI